MYVLVLVINKTEYMEDVLNNLMEIGVKGATILDSQGMGSKILTQQYASSNLFGALKTAFDREHPYNKTIFTVIESQELLDKAIETIRFGQAWRRANVYFTCYKCFGDGA